MELVEGSPPELKGDTAKKQISFWAAVSLGMGAMIGAGIFALLGEAASIAGSATYISFLIGGSIAALSGYSLGKLGARFPSAGGVIEYLIQAFGGGVLTGTMSLTLYLAAIVSLSLVAKTFGNYAAALSGLPTPWLSVALSIAIIVIFVLINLRGAKDVAFWEKITVGIKFCVLAIFIVAGATTMEPRALAPQAYPPFLVIVSSLAITFFAYEGFRVITNAAEDMPNPSVTLPRAIMTAILLVTVIYIGVSVVVFGNLSPDKVVAAKDYALAEAAKPIFGKFGFVVVGIAALVATASAINANLFAVTNVTYRLAVAGILPRVFERPVAHSREGLLISGALILIATAFLDLSAIAAVGSILVLLVHAVTHLGHWRLRSQTGASPTLLIMAIASIVFAMGLSLWFLLSERLETGLLVVGFMASALLLDLALRWFGSGRPDGKGRNEP